jgi:5-methylcytosine-specific restriction endonuclease McrA
MTFADNRRHPGRSGAAWERARKQVLAHASVCAICGRPLNPDAPPRSPWSTSVDHVIPLSAMRGWDRADQAKVATDPAYLRAVHLGCNSSRGNRRLAPPRLTSRAW